MKFYKNTKKEHQITPTIVDEKYLLKKIKESMDEVKILAAKNLTNQIKSRGIQDNIQDAEFKVFSQWGEDGIIQYLVHYLEIEPKTFIEFGVQNYIVSNTRFLLINDNWKGLIIDENGNHIDRIIKDRISWRHDLTAVCAFVDKDNINNIFLENDFCGEIGIQSIDIDGNDYWIWDAINVVDPVLVIIEYNSLFGDKHAVTIPYDPKFNRTQTHYSNLFWGCSLKALCLLAEKKGYIFVGSNSNGNNAFFVRKNKIGNIPSVSIEQGYVEAKFRESRDLQGNLTHLSGKKRLEAIKDCYVYNIETCSNVRIRDLFNL